MTAEALTWPGSAEPWLWTAATWAGLQLVVLAVAAIVAWRQVREARRLREETLRPFVVVDFEVEAPLLYIAVSNTGQTIARDVKVTFDHPLESGALKDKPDSLRQFEARFAEGIHTLPPGKKIRTLVDLGPRRPEGAYRDIYLVEITYASDATQRHYADAITLDYGIYRGLVRVNRNGLHEINDRLKELVDAVKRLEQQLTAPQP